MPSATAAPRSSSNYRTGTVVGYGCPADPTDPLPAVADAGPHPADPTVPLPAVTGAGHHAADPTVPYPR